MRHGLSGRKFSRDTNERKALLLNLAKSLIEFEQIKTTLPKAKDLRPYVEKLITLGKLNSLHARRQLIATLGSNEIATKIMSILSTRYGQRPGGYTRIIKTGFRHGDNAEMAVIEFVDRDVNAKPKAVKEDIQEDTNTNA